MQLAVKYLAKPRVKERENSGNSPPKTQNSGFGPGTFRNSENDPTHIVIFRRISPACSDLPKSTINITLYSPFELQLSTMDPSESSVVRGATFDSLQELKDACKAYSIENAFEYKVVKANQTRFTITCKAEACPWRLHASSVQGSSPFRIKTYESEHACFGINHQGHAQASKAFLAKHIADKLKEQPSYRPVDIVRDVQRELGVKITYSKAFSAKEHTKELNNGTHDAAYQALPKYCQDIVTSNPNSIAILEKTPENKFRRFFIFYGACSSGFVYCRPFIGLDGTHLKHKYQGTIHFHVAKCRDSSHGYRSRCERFTLPSCLCGRRCRKR